MERRSSSSSSSSSSSFSPPAWLTLVVTCVVIAVFMVFVVRSRLPPDAPHHQALASSLAAAARASLSSSSSSSSSALVDLDPSLAIRKQAVKSESQWIAGRVYDRALSSYERSTLGDLRAFWQRPMRLDNKLVAPPPQCTTRYAHELAAAEQREHGLAPLPSASVVIAFRNESDAMLGLTVQSLCRNAGVRPGAPPPPELLQIILVDDNGLPGSDAGDDEHDAYTLRQPHPAVFDLCASYDVPVRVQRNERSEGLMRARMAGLHAAHGDAVIFLDSHVEANQNWLLPLLIELRRRPRAVVVPRIELLDDEPPHLYRPSAVAPGGFDTSLTFRWLRTLATHDGVSTLESPAMPGGLFGVMTDYFLSLGGYDEGLDVWGGENMEVSLKSWLCGDGIVIVPCSRIGHMFRTHYRQFRHNFPYSFAANHVGGAAVDNPDVVVRRNTARVARVWTDERFQAEFRRQRHISDDEWRNEALWDADGSLARARAVRDARHCKDFAWFVRTLVPDLYENNRTRGTTATLRPT